MRDYFIMKMTRIFRSLRTRFLFIFIVAILPSFIATFITLRYAERITKAALSAHLQTESQNMANGVLRWLKNRITDAQAMSDFIETSSMNPLQINEYLATMKKHYPDYERILLVNLSGEVVADTANEQGNYRDSIWFQKATEEGEYISDVRESQKPMLLIASTSRQGNEPAGILCVFIRLKDLDDLVLNTSSKSYIVNHNGIIIAHKENERKISEMKNFDLLTREKKPATYIDYRDVEVIGAQTFIPKLQWFSIAEQDADEAFARLNWYKAGILVLFLLLSCIAISVYFLLSSAIVNPIEKLSDAATAIAKGDFDQRLKISRKFTKQSRESWDEVGRLIDVFNKMAQKLRSHYDSLESKIAATTEKLATTDDELKRSREALARSEALIALGQLSAGIAHEIRTPLTSIKLFIQSLEDELPLDEEQSRGFVIIKGEIDRMEETVRRFLDFARTAEPEFEMVNINGIISDAVSLVKTRIKGKGIVIETSDNDLTPISGDKKQLTRVFLNLFLNSIEAMPNGGNITVSASLNEDGESLMITVADTGCGIEVDELPYIFDPFFTTKETGTGMGLAIVYNAIEQHGGNIEVESQLSIGTKFTISLPIVKEEVQLG